MLVRRATVRLLLGATVLLRGIAIAAEAPDVRRLMSPGEFHAAGLDKLDGAEIEALNAWLIRYTAGEAAVLRTSSPAVRAETRRAEAELIRSRIAGRFDGWSGHTVFRLENGQVWQQRIGGVWSHRADAPEVEIRQNLLGMWEMRLPQSGRQIGVKRIE